MSKKDSLLTEGLAGLMAAPKKRQPVEANPTASEPQPSTSTPKKEKGKSTTFSYHLPIEIAEQMKEISWETRRNIGAVVAEAMAQYIEKYNAQKGNK